MSVIERRGRLRMSAAEFMEYLNRQTSEMTIVVNIQSSSGARNDLVSASRSANFAIVGGSSGDVPSSDVVLRSLVEEDPLSSTANNASDSPVVAERSGVPFCMKCNRRGHQRQDCRISKEEAKRIRNTEINPIGSEKWLARQQRSNEWREKVRFYEERKERQRQVRERAAEYRNRRMRMEENHAELQFQAFEGQSLAAPQDP
ncbi:unnamed protein product [Orchesella dallaii]|uniref:CCHC-type domain-containing protein n=1 Tax=Orchesella dallaii TaxID=48710 RepID=A0ABP1S9U5_9HEXA